MLIHNPIFTGSISLNGTDISQVSTVSTDSSSFALRITNNESTSSAFVVASGSFSNRISNTESTASAFILASGSFSTRTTAVEATASQYITASGSLAARLTSNEAKTGSFATTGSNFFIGNQVITGSVYIANDLIVQGSSSLQNITASAVSVGTNTIILNTATPILQFGGISVFDSGSTQGRSGSLLWNSINDHWINVNPSGSDEGYNSAMVINGPKNTGSLGNEAGLTTNYIPVSQGEDHITDSIIFQSGSVNIGIGTTTPSFKLDVSGNGRFKVSTDRNLAVRLDTHITLSAQSDTAAPENLRIYADTFRIYTSTTAVGLTERFSISNIGKVSIGTSTLGNLTVEQTTGESGIVINSSIAEPPMLYLRDAGGAGYSTILANNKLYINASNVGIGLTNPGKKLDISASDENVLRLQRTGASARQWDINIKPNFTIGDNTAAADRFTIDTSGNIGIGTTSSNTRLEVFGTDGSENRTSPYDVLTITAESGNAPYSGFGGGIVFKNRAYNAGVVNSARIRSQINNNSVDNYGGGLVFETTQTTGSAYYNAVAIRYDGNIGIGIASPSYKLDVNRGSSGVVLNLEGENAYNAETGILMSSGRAKISGFLNGSGGTPGTSLRFYTMPDGGSVTERMRIDSNGNVGIGITNPAQRLSISVSASGYIFSSSNTNNSSGTLNALFTMENNANNTSSYHLVCSMPLGDRMYIYGNGNVVNVNGSYGTLSDITLKENIVDTTPKLNDILQLKVRNFNLIGETTKQIGFIAQEFEEVFPAMVDIDGKSGKKTIKTSVLVPMLVKAIQEQQVQIDELKALLNA